MSNAGDFDLSIETMSSMSKLDILKNILLTVESLEEDMISSIEAKAKAAEEYYLQLVEQFYEIKIILWRLNNTRPSKRIMNTSCNC